MKQSILFFLSIWCILPMTSWAQKEAEVHGVYTFVVGENDDITLSEAKHRCIALAKAEAIRNAEVYRKDYVISSCPAEGLKNPTVVAAQAANDLLNINGVKASFVLTEYQGQIFISARSIDEVNVQIIMERLGGGGHINSSGAQLKNTTMEAAIIVVKNTLDYI